MTERHEQARESIERVIGEYQDVFAMEDRADAMAMPILGHWVILVTHDDAQDPTVIANYRLGRKNQATHETVGLLWLALQELSRPMEED